MKMTSLKEIMEEMGDSEEMMEEINFLNSK
jgi:hypothetical protein